MIGNFARITLLKRFASCMGLLVLVACDQNPGGPQIHCAQAQDPQSKFQQVIQSASTLGRTEVLARLSDLKNQIKDLKADLQQRDQDVQIKKIDQDTVAIAMDTKSPAQEILNEYIEDQKITRLETDPETFPFQANENSNSLGVEEKYLGHMAEQSQAEGQELVVAVIDTGVDYSHKDLRPYIWKNTKEIAGNKVDDDGNGYIDDVRGWDFVNEDNDPIADDVGMFHGTHVAGIVKTASQLAAKGLNIKIMPLKYLNAAAAGKTSNAIRALDYAIKNGATVLNNSWGSFAYSSALADAIERTKQAKALFIAAAGNGDYEGRGVNLDKTPFYPAAYPANNIISVAAGSADEMLADFSNFGATTVDLAAPGVGIQSTSNDDSYKVLSGTSMAAPYVSGVAAMLWSLRPDLSYVEIRQIILQSVKKVAGFSGKLSTGGSIDREKAVVLAQNFVHDANNLGEAEASPSGLCGQP